MVIIVLRDQRAAPAKQLAAVTLGIVGWFMALSEMDDLVGMSESLMVHDDDDLMLDLLLMFSWAGNSMEETS